MFRVGLAVEKETERDYWLLQRAMLGGDELEHVPAERGAGSKRTVQSFEIGARKRVGGVI
jgi:hypothetical protein